MKLAIVGVTGLVGQEMLRLIDGGYLAGCDEIIPIASGKSVGSTSRSLGGDWRITSAHVGGFGGAGQY